MIQAVNRPASSAVAAVPATARSQMVRASASVQLTSGNWSRPWSVARQPAAAKSACRRSSAATRPVKLSAPMPAASESRRTQGPSRRGSCTLSAASGRNVGTTRVPESVAAIRSCHSRLSAGSSVVPTSSTRNRRRMPRAVRSPVASCRLASVQTASAVAGSRSRSMPKYLRSSRWVQWKSGLRSVAGTVSAHAWNFSRGLAAPVIRSSATPQARMARHL